MFAKERATILNKIADFQEAESRIVIAIAGPPAAGKSALAELVVHDLNAEEANCAALVPMDGYHLDNDILDAHGLKNRKGAPQTFDADGFVALVEKIAKGGTKVTYPTFDRTADKAIPDSASVDEATKIIVVEGNYLLLNGKPWCELNQHFDLTVCIKPHIDILKKRLINRWLAHGFDQARAEKKAFSNDIPNANYVLENSVSADLEFGIA